MLNRIYHLGYAVEDIEAASRFYEENFGAVPGEPEVLEEQGIIATMFKIGESSIELVQPTRPDSPVGKFLAKRGEGFHHVAFEVEDLDGTLAQLKRNGVETTAYTFANGQVTLGNAVLKHGARKIRRLYNDKILAGFAGSAADGFALFTRFEERLEEFHGNLERAAVELAKDWRTDRVLRRLEALLRLDDAPVIVWVDLPELGRQLRPLVEHLLGAYAAGVVEVLLHHGAHQGELLAVLQAVQPHHLLVAQEREVAGLVEHVGNAAGHARGEVLARRPQHDHTPAGHVLAAVVTHGQHHGVHRAAPGHQEYGHEDTGARAGGGAVAEPFAELFRAFAAAYVAASGDHELPEVLPPFFAFRALVLAPGTSVELEEAAERLGERYGVAVHETPVGFKYIGPKMIETGAMMGAEESGGYGFGMHLPERDGIYANLHLRFGTADYDPPTLSTSTSTSTSATNRSRRTSAGCSSCAGSWRRWRQRSRSR